MLSFQAGLDVSPQGSAIIAGNWTPFRKALVSVRFQRTQVVPQDCSNTEALDGGLKVPVISVVSDEMPPTLPLTDHPTQSISQGLLFVRLFVGYGGGGYDRGGYDRY